MSSVQWDAPELAELYDRISDLQYKSGIMLVDKMGIGEGDAVLDVGCGTGRLALYVSKVVGPSGSVVGIDPSPHRIRVAEDKLGGNGSQNLRFKLGQGEDLVQFRDGVFDHVYYSSAFHWIADKPAALAEACRVLRPGGSVGMNTVDRSHPFEMKKIMEDLFGRPPYAGYVNMDTELSLLIDRDELMALLSDAGFRGIRIDSVSEKHYYASADELFRFIEASSFGNFLREVPGEIRRDLLRDMKKELEKMRTPEGIGLQSSMMFATGKKPG